jgi:hypothetical protein
VGHPLSTNLRLTAALRDRYSPRMNKKQKAALERKAARLANFAAEVDDRPEVKELFARLKVELPELQNLLDECNSHWGYEDPVYRFYHQSFKVFALQSSTLEIVQKFQALAPGRELNKWFMEIVREGTGKTFAMEDNDRWLAVTRPMVEAFFHGRFFLEMAVKYGRELEHPPRLLPSGWAAFLYLYDLR